MEPEVSHKHLASHWSPRLIDEINEDFRWDSVVVRELTHYIVDDECLMEDPMDTADRTMGRHVQSADRHSLRKKHVKGQSVSRTKRTKPRCRLTAHNELGIIKAGDRYQVDFVGEAHSTAGFREISGSGKSFPGLLRKGDDAQALLDFWVAD